MSFSQERAIMLNDGDKSQFIWTDRKIFEFVIIDMEAIYKVEKVKVFTRFSFTKQHFSLYVTNKFLSCNIEEDLKLIKECQKDVIGDKGEVNIDCKNDGVSGRYFILMIGDYEAKEVSYSMDLTEIEAYGTFIENVEKEKIEFNDNITIKSLTYKDFPITTQIVTDNEKIEIPNYSTSIINSMSNCQPIIWNNKKFIFSQACLPFDSQKSRLAIFGKDNFYTTYLRSHSNSSFFKLLNKWLCGSTQPTILILNEYKTINELINKMNSHNIIVINIRFKIDKQLLDDLFKITKSSHIGIVLQYHIWYEPHEIINENMRQIEKDYGVRSTNNYVSWSLPINVTLQYNHLNDDYLTLDKLLESVYQSHQYFLLRGTSVFDKINSIPLSLIPLNKLQNLIKDLLKKYDKFLIKYQPCLTYPVYGDNLKLIEIFGELGLLDYMIDSGYILPGVEIFPGIFKTPISTSKYTIKVIGLTNYSANPIGLYLKPGDTLRYRIKSIKGVWKIRIGCHTDRIPYKRVYWYRYPKISKDVKLIQEGSRVYSSYGGVLFLLNNQKDDYIEIEIDNVVRAPFFNLRDENAIDNWNKIEKYQPGLWAQIAGDNMLICEESIKVRNYSGEYLFKLMSNVWDNIVKMYLVMKEIDWRTDRGDMTVVDQQTSVGSGHSGYPIEVHRDWHISLFDWSYLIANGSWGMCHEIGHNKQESSWTFSGTGEVTNNLFALWNFIKIFKLQSYGSSDAHVGEEVKVYLTNPDFKEWQNSPFLALMIYAQLANHLGWGFYHKVFVYYKNEGINPINDSDKINQWINITSIISKQNLIPIFEYWDFPLNDLLSKELASKYDCFLPEDFFANYAKERFNQIKNKYKNCHTKSKFYEDFDYKQLIEGRRKNNFEIV